jgi:hypothetical protein
MCQKAVGGPFAALAAVPVAALVWTRGAPALFRSSSIAQRGFCSVCGTPLIFQDDSGVEIEVTIASLDQPGAVAPVEQVGVESRLAWLDELAGLPARETSGKYTGLVGRQHPDSGG